MSEPLSEKLRNELPKRLQSQVSTENQILLTDKQALVTVAGCIEVPATIGAAVLTFPEIIPTASLGTAAVLGLVAVYAASRH